MEENNGNVQASPVKMLWFAFVGAIAIYVIVGYQKLAEKNQPVAFEVKDLSDGLFIGAVVLAMILIAVAYSYMPKFIKTDDEKQKIVLSILQFAFLDAIGVVGLVVFFSTGSFTQLVVLCLIAIASLLKLFPREV